MSRIKVYKNNRWIYADEAFLTNSGTVTDGSFVMPEPYETDAPVSSNTTAWSNSGQAMKRAVEIRFTIPDRFIGYKIKIDFQVLINSRDNIVKHYEWFIRSGSPQVPEMWLNYKTITSNGYHSPEFSFSKLVDVTPASGKNVSIFAVDRDQVGNAPELNWAKMTITAVSPLNTELHIRNGTSSGMIGDITMTLNSAPQPGRLFLDGSTYQISSYPLLAQHIRNNPAYGTVSSRTFTLVDMRGRMPVGKSTDSEFNTLSKKGGAKTATLTQNQLPRIAFTVPHIAYAEAAYLSNGTTSRAGDVVSREGYGRSDSAISNAWRNEFGNNEPHSILNPYIVVNYEIIAQ